VEVAAVGVFIAMLIGSVDSIGTKLFGKPLPGAHEFTIALLVLIIFGGMPYTEFTKSHINITFILDKVGSRKKIILNLISNIIGFFYMSFLTWQNILFAENSLKIREYAQGLFRFPIYPVKIVVAIGLCWMSVQMFLGIFDNAISLKRYNKNPTE
jgi:TRAP-type C4-dicarboxylate transport system permease small subunit